MANTEDYLDGLLDSITQAKAEREKPSEGRARQKRNRRERRRSRIRPDDDFLEANGLRSYREKEDREKRERRTEDDFLRSFEEEFSKDDANDLIRSFERELNEEYDAAEEGSMAEDSLDQDGLSDDGGMDEDMSPADSILANIEGIVSKAKRVATGEDPVSGKEETSIQTDIPISPESEPLSGADEIPLDENGEGSLLGADSQEMDLNDMLASDDSGDLTDIGDLLKADENEDELADAREAFDAAADGIAEGGESIEASEGGGESPEAAVEAGENEEEAKPNLIQKIFGVLGGIFKKKEPAEGEEDEEDEDDENEDDGEDGEGKETKEEKKARLKKEKEEAKKKKKEEADAKKKAKDEEKKKKAEEKKKKAAEKAAKPKKKKPKKPKERSPKIPIPVMVVFVFFSISLIASTRIMENAIGHQRQMANATKAYEKKDYMEAYRTLAGKRDLDKSEAKLRNKAKLMAYMQIKQKEYTICMNSGKQTESGLDRYNIRTNYQMALDSLISAVYFFQENEEKANELGITEEYIKYGQRLEKELDKKFNLTVGEAVDLYRNNNRKSYTAALQSIIREQGLKETY